jgi:hypothetical protein
MHQIGPPGSYCRKDGGRLGKKVHERTTGSKSKFADSSSNLANSTGEYSDFGVWALREPAPVVGCNRRSDTSSVETTR